MLITVKKIGQHTLRDNSIPTHTDWVNFPLPNSICALLSDSKCSHSPLDFLPCPSASLGRWESELYTTGIQRKWVIHTWTLWAPAQTPSLAHSCALACILKKEKDRVDVSDELSKINPWAVLTGLLINWQIPSGFSEKLGKVWWYISYKN